MRKWLSLPLLLLGSLHLYAAASPPNAYEKIEDESHLSILNPSLAGRQTMKLRLANGLEAYLVSDPTIEQSAAAVCVEAGHWNDPAEYPGMAHFLEHMLFMGTGAYPHEAEYMQFIGDNGGKVNAYTSSDRTVYMFSINNEAFASGLDRFSHFFIDPLFSPSCIDRELLAVDQEHAKNLEHDGWRQYMIFKETGNPEHPNAKFSTGNAHTLGGIPQKALKEWYKQYYSAQKMHLVVFSNLPLDELVSLTVQDFSAVASHEQPHELFQGSLVSDKQKGKQIYIQPVKDLKVLSLMWEIPLDLAKDQEAKVGDLLAYILESGSNNSLLGLLKSLHLAESISVAQEQCSKHNKLLSIDVELTEKGLQNTDLVTSYCFEALARLKKTGIPQYIFDEVQRIANIQYQYQSRKEAFQFVQENAHKLADEALATYPRKTLLVTKYNPAFIAAYLEELSPENCLYTVVADPSKTGIAPTHSEKWMQAQYAIKPVHQKQLLAWTQTTLNPQIDLPSPNSFIPQNLDLVHTTVSNQPVTPTLLQNDAQAKIFYSDDQKYLVPEIAHSFRLKTPLIDGSAKSKALSDLYIKAANDHLFPTLSAAEAAGSSVSLKEENLAFSVAIHGYSDQSDLLVEQIFEGLKTVHPTREQFELYKQSITAAYENTAKELPLLQSFELLGSILFNNAPTSEEKKYALKSVTYEEFLRFSNDLFKKVYCEGMLYGNLSQAEAEKTWAAAKKKLKSAVYSAEEQKSRRVLILAEGQGPYMISQTTPMQGNAAVLVIEQGPYSFEKRASQQVLGRVLREAFYDTLRTKQQTAYIAQAWEKEEEKQLFQFFAVQSSTHKPHELIARFELFLENFLKQFTTKLSSERFETIRKMSITSLQMPPENLSRMATRLSQLAFDFDGDFQLIEKRIASLEALTYEETREAAKEYLSRKNTRRIAILTEGITPKEKDFRYQEISKKDLLQQGTFVAWK